MGINVFPVPSSGKTTKGQSFTSNGNWTAPAGVNFVTVYALGGGGASMGIASNFGTGGNYNGSNSGGDSTFGTNLVVARGGLSAFNNNVTKASTDGTTNGASSPANSGRAGQCSSTSGAGSTFAIVGPDVGAKDGSQITATVAVTPGTNYAISVGAGGNIGNFNAADGYRALGPGAGGSGFVSLTWEE